MTMMRVLRALIAVRGEGASVIGGSRGLSMRLAVAFLALTVLSAVVLPAAWSDDTVGKSRPVAGGTGLTHTVGDAVAVTQPLMTGAFYTRTNSFETSFTVRGSAPYIRRVDTTYSDTIQLSGENDVAGPMTDTTRTVRTGETGVFILRVSNLGNVRDSIGLVFDTAVAAGFAGLDTWNNWSARIYDSRGVAISGRINGRGADTAFIRLSANGSETFIVRMYADNIVPDTSWINFTLRTFVGNGNPNQFAIQAYPGFNGDTYGGDGHDSITLFVGIRSASLLRVAKIDTAFAPVSLGVVGTFSTADTQHRIPGATLVYTLWFDNDDSTTVDTIVLEDWIDTRFVRFDSGGLTYAAGGKSAAGAYVAAQYGAVLVDSGMPLNSAAAKFDVRVEYYTTTGARAALTPAVNPASVGRIRWTITQSGGTQSLLGPTNGNDDASSIDAAPTAISAARDSDMGYVRYSVVLLTDTTSSSKTGRPDSGMFIARVSSPSLRETSYIEPNDRPVDSVAFVYASAAEYLPHLDFVPETQTARKSHQSGGDTFFYAQKISSSGNSVDSVALNGTTAISGSYVRFYRDIGSVGSYDGSEPTIDTITLAEFDTVNVLVAVYLPSSFTGSETAHLKLTSVRNPLYYDTAFDLFTVIGESTVVVTEPVSTGVGPNDSLAFVIRVGVPPVEDTVIITLGPISAIVIFDSAGNPQSLTPGVTVTMDPVTGELTITFLNKPNSDTYVWQITILDNVGGVIDTTFIDTGSVIIDTMPPAFNGTANRLFIVDTTLVGNETAAVVRLYDTAISDTQSGIDYVVLTVRDTAGNYIRSDTFDLPLIYQIPIDIAGAYTLEMVVVDIAGNTGVLSDSIMIVIPVRRALNLVAMDNASVVQVDNVAKGLRAKGWVTVLDPSANTNGTVAQSIFVTITSDVDPVGILLELFETGGSTGVFEEGFSFTNGVSNTAARKIKVRHGSIIAAAYDPDGSGPIATMTDQISWEGLLVQTLDQVRTWPNPFNGTTDGAIIFQNLPPDPAMSIEIMNLQGEKVRTLRVGDGITFTAAQNTGRWDARNLRGQLSASGTYVYIVRSSYGTKVAKFTVVH